METGRKLLILRSGMNIESYQNKTYSPVTSGNQREKQYIDGISSILKFDRIKEFSKIVFVDNTISTLDSFPKEILKLIESPISILLPGSNLFGIYNKGAGDIETLIAIQDTIQNYDYCLIQECRLKVVNYVHFENTLDSANDILYKEHKRNRIGILSPKVKAIKTGYFGLSSSELINFVNSINLERMVVERESIENLLYNYAKKRSLRLSRESFNCLRCEPISGKYIKY